MTTRIKLGLALAAYALFCWFAAAQPRATVASPLRVEVHAAQACAQEPTLSLRTEGSRVVVEGELPDDASLRLVRTRAAQGFTGRGLDDRLTVSRQLRQAAWVGLTPALLGLFGRLSGDASLAIRGGTAVVTGTVPSEAVRSEISQGVRAAIPGDVQIVDRLVVTAPDAPVAADAPAAEPAREALQRALDQALAGRTIAFTVTSDSLTLSSVPVLAQVAAALRRWPAPPVEVQGHTDNVGGAAVNLELSQRRAAAVVRYLLATYPIPPSRLRAAGYGADRPVADNGTPEGRQRNRRIQFLVLDEARP